MKNYVQPNPKGVIIYLHQFDTNQFKKKNWTKDNQIKKIDKIGYDLNYQVVHVRYSFDNILDDFYIEKIFKELSFYFNENWDQYPEMYLVFSKWAKAKKVIEKTLFKTIENNFNKQTLKSLTEIAKEQLIIDRKNCLDEGFGRGMDLNFSDDTDDADDPF